MTTHKSIRLGLKDEARRVRYTLSVVDASTLNVAGQFYNYNYEPCRGPISFKAWITTAFTSWGSFASAGNSVSISLTSGSMTQPTYITAAGNNLYQLEGYSTRSGYFTLAVSTGDTWNSCLHMIINNKYLIHIPATSGGCTSALASAGFSGWGE